MQQKVTNMYILRKRLGLSQQDIAQRIGRSQPIVSKIENGISANPELVKKIAEILECTDSELVKVLEDGHSSI